MTSEERLAYLARQLYDHSQEDKLLKQTRGEDKEKFFELLEDKLRGKDHLLPVRTIEVPEEFFTRTGMSKEDFVQTRFPGWNIEHCEKNTVTGQTVFVFKRDPRYVPDVVELEDGDHLIRVQKEIAEYTPEIDWETLKLEDLDLHNRLAKPVTTYEVDGDELEAIMRESPEELAVLQRHMSVKEPARKVVARRVKNGRESLK
jgi:hypothetical protein